MGDTPRTVAAMEIEYDPVKAAANPLNHEGVTFDEAQAVLLDPNALTQEDRDEAGEQRVRHPRDGWKGSSVGCRLDLARRAYPPHLRLEGQSVAASMR